MLWVGLVARLGAQNPSALPGGGTPYSYSTFNVLAYGARGDSVTDDTKAVQAALTAACGYPYRRGITPGDGLVVLFPAGRYRITQQLSVTCALVLQGATMEGTILVWNPVTPGVMVNWNDAVTHVRIGQGLRDMSFYGQGPNDGNTFIQLTNAFGFTMMQSNVSNFNVAFGTLTQVSYLTINRCFFSNDSTVINDATWTGSTEQMNVYASTFAQNTDENVGIWAVFLTQSTADWHFVGTSFDSDRLVLQGGTVTTDGCHFEDPNDELSTTSLVVWNTGGTANWTSVGDYFLTQSTSTAIIGWGGGNATILGRWHAAGVTASAPAFIALSGAANLILQSNALYANVTAVTSGSTTGAFGVLGSSPTVILKSGSGSANYTTATTAYVPVDLTNLRYTAVVPTGYKLAIVASGSITTDVGVATAEVAIQDSVSGSANFRQQALMVPSAATVPGAFALNYVITGDNNSHTVDLRFRTLTAADSCIILNNGGSVTPQLTLTLTPSN